MYTRTLSTIGNLAHYLQEGAHETLLGADTMSEGRKEEIMKMVDAAMLQNAEHDPNHAALTLAVQQGLDPVLNDPKRVLAMIDYAQEHGKSPETVLAISQRFAKLIGDTAYAAQLGAIEARMNQDKHAVLEQNNTIIDAIKHTVQDKVNNNVT